MSADNTSDDGYTPIWVFSSWAEHWFTGVACGIIGNILVFYVTRIYGRRLAIERVMKSERSRLKRGDSFFAENEGAVTPASPAAATTDVSMLKTTSSPLPAGNGDAVTTEDNKLMRSSLPTNVENETSAVGGVKTALPPPVLRKRSNSQPASNNLSPFSSSGIIKTKSAPAVIKATGDNPESKQGTQIRQETKRMDLVWVVVLALLIQAVQFAALAIVSLALVAPLTSLFFVWWRIATMETDRRKIRKEMSQPSKCSPLLYFASMRRVLTIRLFLIITVLVTATVFVTIGGPHEMYVVAVQKVVRLDFALMIYISIVVLVIVFNGFLNQSPSTMEWISKWFGLKRTTDLEPLLLGTNAGLLGGQYLLLVKLLAEIMEAAFLMPQERPSAETTFIIVVFCVCIGSFHIWVWRRGMGTSRTKLFIPVYRFWFIISGTVASILVLREFFESPPGMIALYFVGVFMDLIVLFIMSRNALNAVKRDDFSTVIFLEEDPEQGIELPKGSSSSNESRFRTRMGRRNLRRKFARRGDSGTAPLGGSAGLANQGLAMPGLRRAFSAPVSRERAASADTVLSPTRAYAAQREMSWGGNEDSMLERTRRGGGRRTPRNSLADYQSSELFASAAQIPTPKSTRNDSGGNHAFERRHSYGKESADSSFARRSYSRERRISRISLDESDDVSDGYESAGSFHSEPAGESRLLSFQMPSQSVSTPRKLELNYDYTSPTSMIVPMGTWNPWAAEGTSYFFDCAAVPGSFKVRGFNYLDDGVKIKSDVSAMKLVMAEWLPYPDNPIRNICKHPDHFVQREHEGRKDRPFLFVINLLVPSVGNAVFTYARRPNLEQDPVFEKMLKEFMEHPDDAHRNGRLKIIPSIPEGSFIAKRAVGSKPGLISAKVPTTYFKGENWYECCIDVAQSRVAWSVMGAVKGFASSLSLQLGWVIESQLAHELPERVLGGVSVIKPQMAPDPQVPKKANGAAAPTSAKSNALATQ